MPPLERKELCCHYALSHTCSYYWLGYLLHNSYAEPTGKVIHGNAGSEVFAERFATFNEPWIMTYFPNGDLFVIEKDRHFIFVQPV